MNIYPVGSLVDFSGTTLEDGIWNAGPGVYVAGSLIDEKVSLILYLGDSGTAVVTAVNNEEISLSLDQEVEEFENRKKFINDQIIPALKIGAVANENSFN